MTSRRRRCYLEEVSAYSLFGKRALDLAVAVPAIVMAAPVIAAAALAVRVTIGAPVLFRQQRPGLHGRPFQVVKMRTMTTATDAGGALLPDEQRLTTLGTVLRKLSIDELPQLWNVVEGSMSLVGPRPLLMQYLARYSPEQARRHDVKPGITGQAQVHGRNTLSWDEKLAFDTWYVDHVSFAVDVGILAKTALQVVRSDGISAAGHVTMPEFMGSQA